MRGSGGGVAAAAGGVAAAADPRAVVAGAAAIEALQVAPQHAVLLLRAPDGARSVLKLAPGAAPAAPPHVAALAGAGAGASAGAGAARAFVLAHEWQLRSESGAEYSYWTARVARNWLARAWASVGARLGLGDGGGGASYTCELIHPASDAQVARHSPAPALAMVLESAAQYVALHKPLIEAAVARGSLRWIDNVVAGVKERERLLLDHAAFVLNIDTKWKSHPDAKTVPRAEWRAHEACEELYVLAILKERGLFTLRELRGRHADVLEAVEREGTRVIAEVYGVPAEQLRIFVHYVPQFYQLHVHFTRLHNDVGCQAERAHLVSDIVQNLRADGDWYLKRSIRFKLPVTDALYLAMREQQLQREQQELQRGL